MSKSLFGKCDLMIKLCDLYEYGHLLEEVSYYIV